MADKPKAMQRRVYVVDYDPGWPARFEGEERAIRAALRAPIVAFHHIGSTSVVGLKAKPIIDMLIEVARVEALDDEVETMVGLGYHPWGENGIAGRRYFSKGSAQERTHNLHAFGTGDGNLARHLAFRDYLRAHPDVATEYGALKSRLAAAANNDIEVYMQGKHAFIVEHEARALAWCADYPQNGST